LVNSAFSVKRLSLGGRRILPALVKQYTQSSR
jgi:hypothetical protein